MPDHRRGPASGRSSRRIAPLIAALIAALVAACGSTGPSATPGASGSAAPPSSPTRTQPSTADASPVGDPAAIYRTIEDQVVAIRGLQPKSAVSPKLIDDAGIKKLIGDSFRKDNPADLLAANERLMKAFGLLPANASLSDLYISLLGSQVAGLYSPDDKQLYVVSKRGAVGAVEKTTFSHEFTHALQDQNFDLGSLKLDEVGQGDRSFARLALVEGDATLLMSYWQIQHLSQAELGAILAAGTSDDSTKVLLAMPPILRESLLFPYIQGLGFVQRLQAAGGWAAVNAAFAAPPAATEQIIHPDKYAAHEAPVSADLPKDLAARLGSGWKVTLQDSFGELQMQIWLKQNTAAPAATAIDAAAGWGGDRVAVLEGPNGAWGVAMRTVWDSDADASAFDAAATPVVAALASPGAVLPGPGGRERWVVVGSDDQTLNRLSGVLGLAG